MQEISCLAAKPVSFSRRTLLQGVSKYIQFLILLQILKEMSETCIHYFFITYINGRISMYRVISILLQQHVQTSSHHHAI